VKHETGWQVSGDPAGELIWTSPTGHTYRAPPGQYDLPVHEEPQPEPDGHDDPPPF
jgi:hypothetical protein